MEVGRAGARANAKLRRLSRFAAAAVACFAMTFTHVSSSPAQDAQTAGADLAHAMTRLAARLQNRQHIAIERRGARRRG